MSKTDGEMRAEAPKIERVSGAGNAIGELFERQLTELSKRVLAASEELGPFRPNGMQLEYHDDGIQYTYGGDIVLPVLVDGVETDLTGGELLSTLCGTSQIGLSDHGTFSHFTLLLGGEVELNRIVLPRPMRRVVAWDLHNVISHVGAWHERLPYEGLDERLGKTFQELHVKHVIERLGIRRGPTGRRSRLGAIKRKVQASEESIEPVDQASQRYLDDVSDTGALVTSEADFWHGVSPDVPPWRFLWVEGQDAQYTRHAGRDTIAGHLAEKVFSRLDLEHGEVVQRRTGPERVRPEADLGEGVSRRYVGDRTVDPAEDAATNELLEAVERLAGHDVFVRIELQGKTQQQVATELGLTQGRASQILKDFRKKAQRVAVDLGFRTEKT